MKRTYTREELPNLLDVLRKAGYGYFRDPKTQEESFVLRLTADFYPRFHLYVLEDDKGITLNLHLDQKKPSYGDNTAHSGEYEGPTVEKEMRRLDGWVRHATKQVDQQLAQDHELEDRMKVSWFRQKFTKMMQKLFPGPDDEHRYLK